MKRILTLCAICLAVSATVQAQINPSVLYSTHLKTASSRYIPSRIGADVDRAELSLLILPFGGSNYFNASNNAFGGTDLIDFGTKDTYTVQDIEELVDKAKGLNNFAYTAQLQPLGVTWWMKKDGEKLGAFQFNINANIHFNAQINDTLIRTIFEGNSQFAGQTVNIGNMRANALGYVEYGLGYSMPLKMLDIQAFGKKVLLTPAIRVKALAGFAGASTDRSQIAMTTEQDGDYIDFEYNYRFNVAGIDQNDEFAPGFNGMGGAVDLGLNADFGSNYSVSISAIDIGKINFNKNTRNYSNSGISRYDGINIDIVDLANDGETDLSFSDELDDIFDPQETNEDFSMNPGTQLILHFEYRRRRLQLPSSGVTWYKHNFAFTYIQGFERQLHVTDRPQLGMAYTLNCKNKFNVGLNAMFLGNQKVGTLGAFISANAGPVKLGIGFDHLLGPIGSGGGFSYNLLWSF